MSNLETINADIRANRIAGYRTSYGRLGRMAKVVFPRLENRSNFHAAMAIIGDLGLDAQSFCCRANGTYNVKAMAAKAWGKALGEALGAQVAFLETLKVN